MKKILSFLLLLTLGISVDAQTFIVDGLRYTVLSGNTVKTDINYDMGINDYDIPEIVEYDGRTYAVSCIGSHLTSIESTSVRYPKQFRL